MQKIDKTKDYSGRPMERGDTVTTINGYLTARICDIAHDGDTTFVRLRPLHQPYGPGTWHAADRVIWVSAASRRKKKTRRPAPAGDRAKEEVEAASKPAGGSHKSAAEKQSTRAVGQKSM